MHPSSDEPSGPGLASMRTLEIVVAALLIAGSSVVIWDSMRLGFGWRDDGPAPGFFPFWVAVILGGSSIVNLVRAALDSEAAGEAFVTKSALGRVLAVLVPTFIYIAAIGGIGLGPVAVPGLGIYVSSALFIAGFMIWIGGESVLKAALVGLGVPLVMFMMFERWFLVPLPKGPLEAVLGLG